jgi:excisionase family DNA binding protein
MQATQIDAVAVTIPEACRLSGLGRSKIYSEINTGRLPIRKAGSRTLIRVVDLKAYIDALPSGGPAAETE